MKRLVRLAFLSFGFYFLIQYSISIRIDADVNESYTKSSVFLAAPSESPVQTEPVQVTEPVEAVESVELTGSAGPTDTPKLLETQTKNNDELAPYRNLPYYIHGYDDRYVAYRLKNPDLPSDTIAAYVNIGLDKPFYADINTIANPESLTVLINKYNRLPDDYVPKLSQIDPAFCDPVKSRQYMRPEAKDAFEKMCRDAKGLGLNILACGSYRNIKDQEYIWNKKMKEGESIEEIDAYNARGGHSEHNAGLAVDIAGKYSIVNTEEFIWYIKNAHKYGFILRYQADWKSVTGYNYEPWHLRYVGEETASAVFESGLSYDEYYVRKQGDGSSASKN